MSIMKTFRIKLYKVIYFESNFRKHNKRPASQFSHVTEYCLTPPLLRCMNNANDKKKEEEEVFDETDNEIYVC